MLGAGFPQRIAILCFSTILLNTYDISVRLFASVMQALSYGTLTTACQIFSGKKYVITPWLEQRLMLVDDEDVRKSINRVLKCLRKNNPPSSVADIRQAILRNQCTLRVTGDVYKPQGWFHCEDCWPAKSSYGACITCALNEHLTHRIIYKTSNRYKCDCQQSRCSCAKPSSANDGDDADYPGLW